VAASPRRAALWKRSDAEWAIVAPLLFRPRFECLRLGQRTIVEQAMDEALDEQQGGLALCGMGGVIDRRLRI